MFSLVKKFFHVFKYFLDGTVLSDCSSILFLSLTSVDTVLGRHLGVSTLVVFVLDLLFQTSWFLRVRRAVHVCEDFSS